MKNLSNIDLEEVINYLCEIQNRLKDYSHIEQHINKGIITAVDRQLKQAYKEEQRRADL